MIFCHPTAFSVLITLVILVFNFIGCHHEASAELTAADQQAIREATAVAVQMGNESKDWTVYTEYYYAPDVRVLPPNSEAIEGHEEIISFFEMFPPFSEMQFEIIEIGGAGGVAYVYGEYSLTMEAEEEMPVEDKGKYIEIWKRQPDGQWKVALDIFNTNLPPVESETMQ